ncbi:hypothetical protein CSC42_0004 [Pseudomonas aeruginosa]|nr:hypothetical protein CSC42_0004 [Pseudomonas aeruginosa]
MRGLRHGPHLLTWYRRRPGERRERPQPGAARQAGKLAEETVLSLGSADDTMDVIIIGTSFTTTRSCRAC